MKILLDECITKTTKRAFERTGPTSAKNKLVTNNKVLSQYTLESLAT
jgi:hypothetical protein